MNDLDSYRKMGVNIKGKWYYTMSSIKYQSHDLDISVNEGEIINVKILNNSSFLNKCFMTLTIQQRCDNI